MATDSLPPGKKREKVALRPGFHLTDWAKLSRAATDLSGRNGEPLRKVSWKELAEHNSTYDCWIAYNGKVFNISTYLPYHPGGEPILMDYAGKDCTAAFNKYHRWVNCDSMLKKCQVGILMSEESPLEEGDEEEEEITPMSSTTAISSTSTTIESSKSEPTSTLDSSEISSSNPSSPSTSPSFLGSTLSSLSSAISRPISRIIPLARIPPVSSSSSSSSSTTTSSGKSVQFQEAEESAPSPSSTPSPRRSEGKEEKEEYKNEKIEAEDLREMALHKLSLDPDDG